MIPCFNISSNTFKFAPKLLHKIPNYIKVANINLGYLICAPNCNYFFNSIQKSFVALDMLGFDIMKYYL